MFYIYCSLLFLFGLCQKEIVVSYWLEVLYSSSDREIPHYSLGTLREAGVSCNYCLQLPCITEREGCFSFRSWCSSSPEYCEKIQGLQRVLQNAKKGWLMGKFPVSGAQT